MLSEGSVIGKELFQCNGKRRARGIIIVEKSHRARQIKPAGGTVGNYLDRYAQRRYNINFKDIRAGDTARRNQVALDVVDSAGRANPGVTTFLRTSSRVSQAVVVIGIGCLSIPSRRLQSG